MDKLNIYLAGACKHLADEGAGWRNEAVKKINTIAEWDGKSVNVINPIKYFSYNANKHKTHRQVKDFYMYKIRTSDVVLVNLNDSDMSVGTGQELQAAVMYGIPIVGFGTENIYPWLEVDCQVVFDSLTVAIDYIRDYYME